MEGLLVFDHTTPQPTLTLVPQPQIPKITRSKAGCLTCRARRKKCGEHKPVCIGCARNHLLCTWPTLSVHRQFPAEPSIQDGASVDNPTGTGSNQVPLSSNGSVLNSSRDLDSLRYKRVVTPSNPATASRPGTSPAWLPKLQHDQDAQRLLQHYVERTASKLAAINFPDKPFVSHLLPLASTNDGIMHAILALSSSHLSFRDEDLTAVAYSHYAVALRAAKYEVTNVANGKRNEALHLLVLLLLLCQFEGAYGDMQGAILYHLNGCKALLSMTQELLQSTDENFACFLLEQYVYLKIVANNVGLTTQPKETNSSIIKELTGSICSLVLRSRTQGFMFGYAYELFDLIPRIAQFAHKRVSSTSPTPDDVELPEEFLGFEHRILEWKPPPRSSFTSALIDKELDDTARSAGLLYQQALLIFLRIALNGPGLPARHLMVQIGHSINESLQLLGTSLPRDSTLWTTLLWAVLTVGSCLTKAEDQQFLTSVLQNEGHEMYGSIRVMTVLNWIWEHCQEDEKFYGPYGIDGVMRLYNVQLSFA